MTGSPAAAALKPHIGGLLQALSQSVGNGNDVGSQQEGDEGSLAMNADLPSSSHHHRLSLNNNHHKTIDPISSSDYTSSRIHVSLSEDDDDNDNSMGAEDGMAFQAASPMLGTFLPRLLEQAKKDSKGLSSVPQSILQNSLQVVVTALERLDAQSLLDLEILPQQHQDDHQPPPGPRLRDGVYCQPINDQIEPAVDEQPNHSCVRYLHVCEVPDQYSIGIFVFGPNARIPLHDHPDMCVLSRILYGDLHRLSLDLARPEETDTAHLEKETHSSSSWFRNSWFGRQHHHNPMVPSHLPKGTKAARKNEMDHLQAPDVTVLYPYEGNLHEFVAGPQGAAVLDVLLPPYDNAQNRDCTFYNIIHNNNTLSDGRRPSSNNNNNNIMEQHSPEDFRKQEPCFIVPTGQPENFHCISGQYRDLGEQNNHSNDDDDDDDDEEDDEESEVMDEE